MDKYKIFETDHFRDDVDSNLGSHKERIKHKLEHYVYPQLRTSPHFGKNIKKLVNHSPETWRYRIGDHRFFYCIDEKREYVMMLAVDLRRDAY